MPKPPKDGDYFDKVNYVIDAWSRPCDAPWYIYVNTLKPAALEAFITLISFGWGDVARGFARPPGTGSRRTGKRKGKWRRAVPRFPEIGNLLGKQIPGATSIQAIKYGTLGRFLWRIDTKIQGFLLAWLVIDVGVDFAFNWTSQLYQTRWCEASSKGRFSYQKGIDEIFAPGIWNRIAYTDEDYAFSPPFWNTDHGGSGPNGCTMGFGINFFPFFDDDPPTAYALRVRDLDTGVEYARTENNPAQEFGTGSAACIAYLPANVNFVVEAFPTDGWGRSNDGSIAGTED